ncbi:MAG: hypothetical protein AB1512_20925 [Thermodesulfobacteriota bacterium]
MKDIGVAEVFCEILSGIVLAAVIVPFLVIRGVADIPSITAFMGKHMNAATLTMAIAACYFLGLIMDAVGLAVGERCLDSRVCKDAPSSEEMQLFWKAVPEHVLTYRDTQWAYYSMYRNLFLLLIPGSLLWCCVAWAHSGWLWGLLTLVASALLELCFWRTMKCLLELYYTITKSANKPAGGDA